MYIYIYTCIFAVLCCVAVWSDSKFGVRVQSVLLVFFSPPTNMVARHPARALAGPSWPKPMAAAGPALPQGAFIAKPYSLCLYKYTVK